MANVQEQVKRLRDYLGRYWARVSQQEAMEFESILGKEFTSVYIEGSYESAVKVVTYLLTCGKMISHRSVTTYELVQSSFESSEEIIGTCRDNATPGIIVHHPLNQAAHKLTEEIACQFIRIRYNEGKKTVVIAERPMSGVRKTCEQLGIKIMAIGGGDTHTPSSSVPISIVSKVKKNNGGVEQL